MWHPTGQPDSLSVVAAERPGRPRVLVVEDDERVRQVMSELFAEEGFEVRGAGDGVQALAALEDWVPDCIVLDLMMPVMDGWSFRREQLNRETLRDVPVVVVSAKRVIEPPEPELAPQVVFAKPFALSELVRTVARLVAS